MSIKAVPWHEDGLFLSLQSNHEVQCFIKPVSFGNSYLVTQFILYQLDTVSFTTE